MTEFDVSAIKSVKGLLKIFQAFINLFGALFCLVSIYTFTSQINFFEFVSMTGFILDLLLLAMDLVKISLQIKVMPYIEMALDGIWLLFYLIAANIIINFVQFDGRLSVSVFCGYVAMVTYFIDAMIVFKKLRCPISAPQSHRGNQPDTTSWG